MSRKIALFFTLIAWQTFACPPQALAQGWFDQIKQTVKQTVQDKFNNGQNGAGGYPPGAYPANAGPQGYPAPNNYAPGASSANSAYPTGNMGYGNDDRNQPRDTNQLPAAGPSISLPIHSVDNTAYPERDPGRQLPPALFAQLSKQMGRQLDAGFISGPLKHGMPVVGQTEIEINGLKYSYRPDGSWCSLCDTRDDGTPTITAGCRLITAGKLYELDRNTSVWHVFADAPYVQQDPHIYVPPQQPGVFYGEAGKRQLAQMGIVMPTNPIPTGAHGPANLITSYASMPGAQNIPARGPSIPVPILDFTSPAVSNTEVSDRNQRNWNIKEIGWGEDNAVDVPPALHAQIGQQFHTGWKVMTQVCGKRNHGYPIPDETYLRINGNQFKYRSDGTWCQGCDDQVNGGAIKPTSVILSGGKFYWLNPYTLQLEYYSKP